MVKSHLICHNQLLRTCQSMINHLHLRRTLEAIHQMKTNKAAGLDCAITAEALQGGGDAMADVIHCFCAGSQQGSKIQSNCINHPYGRLSKAVVWRARGPLWGSHIYYHEGRKIWSHSLFRSTAYWRVGEEQVLLGSFGTAEPTNLSHTDSTWDGMTGASGVGASFPELWGSGRKIALQLYPG